MATITIAHGPFRSVTDTPDLDEVARLARAAAEKGHAVTIDYREEAAA